MEKVTINGKEYIGRRETFKCTAYTSAPSEGGSLSYTGEKLRDGHIAADFKKLPIGTKVYIPYFGKIYTVVDTGSAIKNNRLDIWMKTRQQALQFGIRNLEVIILQA